MKCEPLGLAPSFGFGDRIGLATPGHVESMNRAGSGIEPIYPQQSIREMTRTQRTAQNVMDDALNGAQAAGWTGKVGADADHLKTPEDVDVTAAVGFTFFTIDPSDDVDQAADDYDEATVRAKFDEVKGLASWYDGYVGKSVGLSTGTTVELTEAACMRAAVKYGKAIARALSMGDYIKKVHDEAGKDYEIELSVDETEQPTTLAEHYIIADQCLQGGMKLVKTVLEEDFGYTDLLFVFSGRRGAHCWVSDPEAQDLTNEQRTAILEYIKLYNERLETNSITF